MEFRIELKATGKKATFECVLLFSDRVAQRGHLGIAELSGELANDESFDRFAKFVVIEDIVRSETSHDDALLWRNDDKTLRFDAFESDVDRRFAHAQSLGELSLGKE